MNNSSVRRILGGAIPAAALTLVLASGTVSAQGMMGPGKQQPPSEEQRREMMERYGKGYGYGMGGYGMGPGMMGPGMGGYGMGPGMMMGPGMGGYGMGPGMMGPGMGGYGMGPGMMMGPGMGGYGMGPGMTGPGMGGYGMGSGMAMLDLSEEQQQKLREVQQQIQKQQMEQHGDLQQAMQALHAETSKEDADPEAVGKAYDKFAGVQKKMLETRMQAQKQMREVLTEEQRKQLRGSMGGMW